MISCVTKETESAHQKTLQKVGEITRDDPTASSSEVQQTDTIPEVNKPEPKVFDLGSKSLFTDTCDFYFACDCCSGDLVLKSDLFFYEANYCMADVGLRHGSYEILNDTLTLNFDVTLVKKEYNWENEVDTSAVDYFVKDTLLILPSRRYVVTTCGEKMKLIKIGGDEIGIESDADYRDFVEAMEEEGLITRLASLVK